MIAIRKVTAFLTLLRPANLLVAGVSVAAGGFGCRTGGCVERLSVAALSAMLIAAAGYALNDCYDLEIDRANRPRRPLPLGQLSPAFAYGAALLLLTAGAGIGFILGPGMGLTAAAVAALLWVYAACGKRMALWGNLAVAAASAWAVLYGGMAVADPGRAAFPAAFALLMHFAREIVKDVQDQAGDRAGGAKTTAIVHGRKNSLAIAAGSLGVLFLLTPLPYLLGHYNWLYFVSVVLGVNCFLLWAIRELLTGPDDRRIARLSLLIKLDMVVGLGAIVLGSF